MTKLINKYLVSISPCNRIANPLSFLKRAHSTEQTHKQPDKNLSSSVMGALNSSNNGSYNPPLSIDFIRKLKRPNNVPSLLEYNGGHSFQGSTLEDWLMHTLDEYIQSIAINVSTDNANKERLLHQPATTANSNVYTSACNLVKPTSIKDKNGMHLSMPSITDELNTIGAITKTSSSTATNSTTSIIIYNESEECASLSATSTGSSNNKPEKEEYKKLNSESYSAAISSNIRASCNNLNKNKQEFVDSSVFIQLISKRQEAKFYVQQILTDLLALGVLEYESGFDNAINKTFKVMAANFLFFVRF
jgi:hypothetical protein